MPLGVVVGVRRRCRPESMQCSHVTSRNRLDGSAKDMPSSISGHGWEEHSTVESLRGVVMTDAQHDQPFSRDTSQQAHVIAADKLLNWPDYEVQVIYMVIYWLRSWSLLQHRQGVRNMLGAASRMLEQGV